MKTLPASLLLAATAVVQALGIFRYTKDTMALSGQIFFPVLFALMAIYITWRNTEDKGAFPLAHIIILALALVALGATLAGWNASLYYFYPSYYVFYTVLGLLVLELALRIAALPKKAADQRPARRLPGRTKTKRGTNLVAVRKTTDQDATPTAPAQQADSSAAASAPTEK